MFKKIQYNHLNAKQKENYNFHKIASVLADYGYNCMWLNDDWQGADFIASHIDGSTFLKVQLKGRLTLDKKYEGKQIHVAFRQGEQWFIYPHDEILSSIQTMGLISHTTSWQEKGLYSWKTLPPHIQEVLAPYKIS